MMRYICLLSVLVVITCSETPEGAPSSPPALNGNIQLKNSTSVSVSKSVSLVTNSDKRHVDEFETAHKIPISGDSLMQMQQTQNLLATKERPELNPVLSALINEDVMKSIESKRAAVESEHVTVTEATKMAEAPEGGKATTMLNNIVLLTTELPIQKPIAEMEAGNDGLIDQAITLEEAGSENNQKSRIQIKKGANGVDYEYEYVYYYYDDDEKTEKEKVTSAASSKSRSASAAQDNKDTRGKSRYTNIERSTTSAPENEIPSRGKGRASIPVTEDVDEGRLPAVTRFPPRSKSIEATPTPSTEGGESGEKTRKIAVKRPSLELVDSDSFNTDEKQVKGNRNLDTEAAKSSSSSLGSGDGLKNVESDVSNNKVPESPGSSSAEMAESSTGPDDDTENTTPLMEKVAFDLYAILANENLNMDMTTDSTDADATTDVPETTGGDGLTTDADETEASSSSTSTTSTTTTTTTTTTPEPTTTTTTTTTPASGPGGRRGAIGNAGRNRFRLRSGSAASTSTTESAPTESTTKGRNRFQRPSFGGRNNRPSSTAAPAKEEVVAKEEAKPVSSSSGGGATGGAAGGRGRTRNRFNLRGSTTTTERNAEENAVDAGQVSSTTARTLRARPTLNLRGRGRPTAAAVTTPAPAENNANNDAGSEEKEKEKEKDEKPTVALPTRPSRFNINRPGAGGANRLLPRGRVSLTKTTAAPAPASGSAGGSAETDGDDEEKKEHEVKEGEATDSESPNNESGEEKPAETTTQAVGGLTRLRNRPRIQINTKTEKAKPQPVAINRKVNPLLARRKIALGSSTTEAAPVEGDEEAKSEAEEDKNESAENKDEPKEETTEAVEVSSEQPRGLALLGARRRLPLRKPGTIV